MPFLTVFGACTRATAHETAIWHPGYERWFYPKHLDTRPEIIFTRPIIVDIYKFDNF